MIHSWTDYSMSGRLIFSCINSLIYNLKPSRLLVSCVSPSNFPLILFNNPLWKRSWKACQQFQLNVLRLKALLRRKLLFNFELYYQNKTADLCFSGWVGFRAMVYLALEVTWRDIASPVGASAASKRDAIRTVAPVARCGLIWRRRLTITETVRGKILVPFL